ncbi:Pkinase domain-containing protein [Cephalotus follicularis]|uniref:non-specific serine/threonine protein kinase n=1 Tax=Cephalotus follicularis TaxID=3775 RepID=A0A1Q3BJE1_CEPFO|nr:Pkinase domain-containing protein [Cephalotus follicularis]
MVVTEKCDVYSFGVLVLEVVMGKHPGELLSQVNSSAHQRINLNGLLDPRLSPPFGQRLSHKLSFLLDLAISCLLEDPQSRPTLYNVSRQIEMEASFDQQN